MCGGPAVGAVYREDEVVERVEGVVAGASGGGDPAGGVVGLSGVEGDEGAQELLLGGVAILLTAGDGLAGFRVSSGGAMRLNKPAGAGGVDGAVDGAVGEHGEGFGGFAGGGVGVGDVEGFLVALDVRETGAGIVGRVDGRGVGA